MQRIVQKFGGTSVGSINKIKNVCALIEKKFNKGNQVVVVSSAMSGETNKLVALAENFDVSLNKREYDMIVSTGEQVAIALISMALKEIEITSIVCSTFGSTPWSIHDGNKRSCALPTV